jgi:hypothetical protein
MSNKKITLSASRIATYKLCNMKYYYGYVEGWKKEESSEAQKIGSDYHARLESFLNGELVEHNYLSKTFVDYIDTSNWNVIETEREFNVPLAHGVSLHGFVDGIVEVDGKKYILEHKTTSSKIDYNYEDDLRWDDQIPIYCHATGIYDVLYTVIKKCTLRQGKPSKKNPEGESDEAFYQRKMDWYADKTDEKIRIFKFRRLEEEVAECRDLLVDLAKEMRGRKTFHRNKFACNVFGTCEFKSNCLNYDPACMAGFVKKEK